MNARWTTVVILVTAGLVAGMAVTTEAALIAEETFDYAVNPATLDGGTGFSGAWSGNTNAIGTPGWTYPNLPTAGNRFLRDPNSSSNQIHARLFDVGAGSPADTAGVVSGGKIGADGSTVWMSFLARKDTTSPDGRWPWLSFGTYDGSSARTAVGRSEQTDYWSVTGSLDELGSHARRAGPQCQCARLQRVVESIIRPPYPSLGRGERQCEGHVRRVPPGDHVW